MGRPGQILLAGAIALAMTGSSPAEDPAPLDLIFLPNLTPDMESLPILEAGTAAKSRINARLAELDREALATALICDVDPPRTLAARWVSVEFAGPRYYALLISQEIYCPGAAHGAYLLDPLVFDLATGAEVNGPDLFPVSLQDTDERLEIPDYILGTPELTDLYLSAAGTLDQDCRDAIQSENLGLFEAWPSATLRGVVLAPKGLSHAARSCGDHVTLPLEILRDWGFPDDLIEALEAPMTVP